MLTTSRGVAQDVTRDLTLALHPCTARSQAWRRLAACVPAWLTIAALSLIASGCVGPMQRISNAATSTPPAPPGPVARATARPLVGVAFGGGSARGLAHVGVIRWFEEHRIPIDVAAGTSMGALVGGIFATGLNADELDRLLASMDWDALFGTSNFEFKNIRRKAAARSDPSHIEFGLKRGVVPPPSLNSGEQVDRFLARITAPYSDIERLDDLPTPFRTVAVDLVTATPLVMDRGPLATAMRASMSLPLVFPPVPGEGRLLVDGGMLNNVPADVVRAMGADRVVAVNVGDLNNPESIDVSMLQAANNSVTAMMRASTRLGLAAADIQIDVPLKDYGSLDWRRSAELVEEGYKAAEAMRERLLPLAVSDAEFAAWKQQREQRRRAAAPMPMFVNVEGFATNDRRRLDVLLPRHVGQALDITALEADLSLLTGLDRYETITWRMVKNDAGQSGLMISARPKAYAPPFLMLGLNLENTTSADFQITATARYLAYGLVGSGSELRVDGTLGSNPAAGIELYEPLRGSRFFGTAAGAVTTENATILMDDQIVARYGINRTRALFTGGINLSRISDLRIGGFVGHVDAEVEIGDPRLPELRGAESGLTADWRLDAQDSPVVPSKGTLASVHLTQRLNGPDGVLDDQTIPLNAHMTQLSGTASKFWKVGERNRVFAYGGLGTTFDKTALPTDQFTLGSPLALGAYRSGELRGSHYFLGTAGYLRQVSRLPHFLGGPIFAGGWLENGDAFDDWDNATWRTNASVGVIMDTLLGPVMLAGSAGFDGRWRTYIGIGRIFK